MLPGFRFLFAAIVLSMSILVFGLGAAALLRAAHEQFASNTSLRAAPETSFAQPSEPTKPVLAVLRLEPPAPDPQAVATPADSPATSAPAEPESIVSTSPGPEKTAALSAPEASPPEPARAEAPSGVSPMATEVPPTAAEAPVANGVSPAPADIAVTDEAAANEAKVAASGQPSPPANETASVASEPTSLPAGTNADLIAAKIATLDGPPVTIQNQAPDKAKSAEIKAAEIKGAGIKTLEPDRDEIKKRLRAERARERRRLAARRAQQARQQAALAQQQPASPFAQQPAAPQAAGRYAQPTVPPTQAARFP
jgi:hypothetical protein